MVYKNDGMTRISIKHLMRNHSLTQSEMGDFLGVTQSQVSHLLKGKTNPSGPVYLLVGLLKKSSKDGTFFYSGIKEPVDDPLFYGYLSELNQRLSQADIARLLGVDQASISLWLHKKIKPSKSVKILINLMIEGYFRERIARVINRGIIERSATEY